MLFRSGTWVPPLHVMYDESKNLGSVSYTFVLGLGTWVPPCVRCMTSLRTWVLSPILLSWDWNLSSTTACVARWHDDSKNTLTPSFSMLSLSCASPQNLPLTSLKLNFESQTMLTSATCPPGSPPSPRSSTPHCSPSMSPSRWWKTRPNGPVRPLFISTLLLCAESQDWTGYLEYS